MQYLLWGLLIGMFVSLPIGPLGIMSLKRTINIDWKAGFLSGIGAAISDVIYSTTAVFGIGFISDFLNKYKYQINITTGILFIILGISILIKALDSNKIIEERNKNVHPILANFLLGFANPLTFLIFIAIFTRFDFNLENNSFLLNISFIFSIFIGAVLFWFVVANIIYHFIKNFKIETIFIINKILGILIILFGSYSIIIEIL